MHNVFEKLQFKDQQQMLVLNMPPECQTMLAEMATVTSIDQELQPQRKYDFVLVFVTSCAELRQLAQPVVAQLNADALFWFAYPKKASKKYQTDLSRDDGWQTLGDLGFEGVRQVAIDENWSALRFRHVSFIKTMTRDKQRALSREGKTRAK
jgi:hypothetical protein